VTKPGSKNMKLVQNLDYAQTFLDIAGAAQPDDMQGASLVPLMEGKNPDDWRKSIYYHYYEYPSVHMVPRHNGIRTNRYKLMHFYQFDEWEFYDLKADPDEYNNLYENPEYQQLIKRMKNQLKGLERHYEDDSDMAEKPQSWQDEVRPGTVG
jgi:arylsulfatase A-like enzyme